MKKSKSVKSEHSASSGVSTSNSSDSLNALGIYSRHPEARNPWVNIIIHNIEPDFKELYWNCLETMPIIYSKSGV